MKTLYEQIREDRENCSSSKKTALKKAKSSLRYLKEW